MFLYLYLQDLSEDKLLKSKHVARGDLTSHLLIITNVVLMVCRYCVDSTTGCQTPRSILRLVCDYWRHAFV